MHFDPSRRHFGCLAGAAALTPWLAACGGSSDQEAREEEYVKAVESMFRDYHPPGILAGVHLAGEEPWMAAFGLADVDAGTPLALNSSFPIRSITKSFTVTLLLRLVQSGQLALDHKIGRYFSGVPNGDLINLGDLAGNQSGLADYSVQPGFGQALLENTLRVWTPQELLAFSFAVEPAFLPGAQYQYSNTNTVLLGLLIEQVTGQSLPEVLAAQIFRPLGLRGTIYPFSAVLPAPTPTSYSVNVLTGDVDDQPLISPTSLAGSGAMASTLADLLIWGEALGEGLLLNSSTQALRKSMSRDVTNGPEYDRYGLGIGQIGNWWGHTGTGVGFQVATMNHATRRATISVMLNSTPDPDSARQHFNMAQELFERLAAVV
ncbi:MAG: beta-lactamase family protein [Comamonadaceae bacterium]|nr:beta-lactamase family protein [Comamonadaceae bacterium]